MIRTPSAATGALEGVTRSRVMELVTAAGYTLEAGTWSRSELDGADEVFATMTSLGVVPIVELDGRSLPDRRPAAESLARLLWERAREASVG